MWTNRLRFFGRSRPSPLVADDAVSRSLLGILAILTFLASLAAAAASVVAQSSAAWRRDIAREATIQVRPGPGRDAEADLARAVVLARATPGIADVRAFTRGEAEEMLAPWLGRGLDLSDLPVPRLAALSFTDGARPDLSRLQRRLADEVPSALLDDHAAWLTRLSAAADAAVFGAVSLVLLVLAASALAVAFATRGAMAGNRQVVEVLHLVGAGERFIVREVASRFWRLGRLGAGAGGLAAAALVATIGRLAGGEGAGSTGSAFRVGWAAYLAIGIAGLAAASLAWLISAWTVRRYLRRT